MGDKRIMFGQEPLEENADGNLQFSGRKLLDDGNALFSDLQDVNIPTDLQPTDGEKVVKVYYEDSPDYGDESDGDLVVSADTDIGIVTDLISDVTVGATTIPVRSTTGFVAGMEVCIHQTQGYRDNTKARRGRYEFNRILSINGSNQIILASGLDSSYISDSDGDKQNCTKAQIFKVYNFGTITVDSGFNLGCPTWDGYSGGNLVIRCKTITGAGNITVQGRGYRQLGPAADRWNSSQYSGEGFLGVGWHWAGTRYPTFSGAKGGYERGGHNGAGTDAAYAPSYDWTPEEIAGNVLTWGGAGCFYWTGYPYGAVNSGGGMILYVQDISTFSGALNIRGRADNYYGNQSEGTPGTLRIYNPSGTYSGIAYTTPVLGSGGSGYLVNAIPGAEATVTYVLGPKVSTDVNDSNAEIPTSKAVATYVAGKFLEPLPVRQVDQASYTITSADFGHLLDVVYTGGPVTITVDAGVMSPYDEFTVNRLTSQTVSVVGGTGVSVNGTPQGNGSIDDEFMMAAVRCYGTNLLQLVGNVTVT